MRKLLFGLFSFAALGFGALSAQPAAAQPYYPGYGYYERPVVVRHTRPVVVRHVEYRRPVRVHRPYRAYRPHRYYRQAYMGPRCRVRPERVWTAYGWATRPVRVCRY